MKVTKIQIVTVLLLLAWIAWEIYMKQWAKSQVGAIIRVDLLLIYPLIFIMTVLSILQLVKSRKERQ